MIASLYHSSSLSSLVSILISAATSMTSSRNAAKQQGRILVLIYAQPHATPFNGVALAAYQVLDSLDPSARAGRADLDIPEMEPELPWPMLVERHCDSHC